MLTNDQFHARVQLLVSILNLAQSAAAPGAFKDPELANDAKEALRENVEKAQATFTQLITHIQEKITA